MRLTITRPDDWHLHLRDGAALASVARHTADVFGRAICMPNLKPPVRSTSDAIAYRGRILEAIGDDSGFEPLMTLYLTDNTEPEEIARARASGVVHGVKLYPAGATTNSDAGVTRLDRIDPVLDALATQGMPLLVHGEVTHGDIFDREALFIAKHLAPMVSRHPTLKVVFEHVTTADAVEFVRSGGPNIAATVTAHHLLMDRNALFEGGIRPHRYCLPVLKRARHREALVDAVTSGHPRFFLGTDSAPHARGRKEASCGCAGMYTAPHAMGLYAEVFESAGALEHLEGFASFHGPDFYGLPRNTDSITLVREPESVPDSYAFADSEVVPMRAGGRVAWRVEDAT